MNATVNVGRATRETCAYPHDYNLFDLLRTLPTPDPPWWLRARVMAAIVEEQRRRQRRASRWRRLAFLLALQILAFALYERIHP